MCIFITKQSMESTIVLISFVFSIKVPQISPRRASRAGFDQYFLCMFNKRIPKIFPTRFARRIFISISFVFQQKDPKEIPGVPDFINISLVFPIKGPQFFPGALRAEDFISFPFVFSIEVRSTRGVRKCNIMMAFHPCVHV